MRTPRHVVFGVFRNGGAVAEEHVCLSMKDALKLCRANWPLAETIETWVNEPYEKPQGRKTWL